MANDVKVCQECGAELTSDSLQGLCAQCLLKQGLVASASGVSGQTSAVSGQSALDKTVLDTEPRKPRAGSLPREGQRFGDYQIVRMLGQGGMGTVFEADHLPSERRVALKVLNHALDSPEARQRFLREGQLAASINHPNTVYVFGTEEIDGIPVISMELAPGGTLKDRVKEKGPLPVTEAVDVILQVIAGLEAAHAKGVLHRDIKPANCFVDSDGTVKVGDFGLSISTLARMETQLTATGRILGTPAFSSPEQLRGDELDVGSDIYSVGVTLYYLLTGKVPFEETNLVKLVTMVVERQPASPNKLRPEIPQGLAQVILRCLAKQPARRFANYHQLGQALAPFGSTAPVAAPFGVRFLAGMIDLGLMWLGLALWYRTYEFSWKHFHPPSDLSLDNWLYFIVLLVVAYFTLLEGLRGSSLGKAVCGLRVVGSWQGAPGCSRASLRAVIVTVFWLLWLTLLPVFVKTFIGGSWPAKTRSATVPWRACAGIS